MDMPAQDVPYDADFAPAAALIADPTRAAILRALLPDRPLAAGELAEARTCYDHLAGRAGVELLDGLLRRGLLREQSSDRTMGSYTPPLRFEITGAGAKVLGSFGLNVGEIRRSRRRFAGACIDWTQRRGHLNGALAAAITSRLFEVGWIERGSSGQRRRSVRVTPAGSQGLARTFGLDLVGSCRSCEKS